MTYPRLPEVTSCPPSSPRRPICTGRRAMLLRGTLGLLGLVALAGVGGPATACAQHPYAESARVAPLARQVSVTLEQPGGGSLPTYWDGGSAWVEGRQGQAYTIRVHNHSSRRIEAVVTVDGRDVLTGETGNYARQRGYVIPAHGSVLIDGFRQSLDHVAAFRFTGQRDAYSSRMGTPQHVGVIGVAVFDEKPTRAKRPPQPVQPRPYYSPAEEAPSPEPWSGRGDRPASKRSSDAELGAADERAAPSSAPRGAYEGSYGYGGAPRPRRDEQLGTQYGETRYSSVREVSFRRKNTRRPDALLTVYYDSREGLQARGIVPEPVVTPPYAPYPPDYSPQPFPEARFAPPPPPRRY